MGAYKIRRRCEGKSAKEAQQCTEKREGDGYEHCESCTYRLHLISLVFRPSEFRLKTSIQSSDRAITDIDTPGNETEHQPWTESKLPDQHRLYHVKHRHRIYLCHQQHERLVGKHTCIQSGEKAFDNPLECGSSTVRSISCGGYTWFQFVSKIKVLFSLNLLFEYTIWFFNLLF